MGALLSNQGGGGISTREFLLDNEPIGETGGVDCTYTPTYTGLLVTREEWRRDDNTLIKRVDYTYTGNHVATEVRKVYDDAGDVVVAQLTWTYNYAGNVMTSATMVRNI